MLSKKQLHRLISDISLYYVWVNPDGSIYAVTGADERHRKGNVAAFIGEKTSPPHKESAFNYDTNIPFCL